MVGFVIVLLLLSIAPLAGASVGQITQHVFARGVDKSGSVWKPINVTNAFTQDDSYVYAFTAISSFSKTTFAWSWHDPNGKLYLNQSMMWDACRTHCQFYAAMIVSGKDAALNWGSWKMDLLADGKLLYSDQFTISPVITEEDSWTFDLDAPMHAHVDMAITIHPNKGDWKDYGMLTGERVGNFTAYDYATGRALGVIVAPPTSEEEKTGIIVVFDTPRGNGYKFVLSYDLASAFGTRGTNLFLRWTWNSATRPLPQNVVVILPEDYVFNSIEGAANYTTTTPAKRVVISFSGTASPNAPFGWSVSYGKVVETSRMSSSTMLTSSTSATTEKATGGIPGFPFESIFGGLVTGFALLLIIIRHRREHPPKSVS